MRLLFTQRPNSAEADGQHNNGLVRLQGTMEWEMIHTSWDDGNGNYSNMYQVCFLQGLGIMGESKSRPASAISR